jgi:hypothetical protein
MRLSVVAVVSLLTGCLIPPAASGPAYQPPPPRTDADRRAEWAARSGFPTKKTRGELDQEVARRTAKFKKNGKRATLDLSAPGPFVFDAVDGVCYVLVMRLAGDAQWLPGAEAGLDFVSTDPAGGEIHSGPGLIGPGAIATLGCMQASGQVAMTMKPSIGRDPIGTGNLDLEVYSHVMSRSERAKLEEDEREQIAELERSREAQREREDQARREREIRRQSRSSYPRARGGGGDGSTGGFSGPVSVTIRSSCGRTVPVFYGQKPKFGSGTQSSISTNSVQSHSFRPGDMFWVTDASGNGLDGVTVTERTRTLEIDSSCSRISER